MTDDQNKRRSDIPWPTYSAKTEENVRLWVYRMEYAFEAHKTDESDKVVNAMLRLEDKAAKWYMSLEISLGRRPFGNWAEFANNIVARFEPKNMQHRLREQLQVSYTWPYDISTGI